MRLNQPLPHSIPRRKRDLFLQLQKTGKVTMEKFLKSLKIESAQPGPACKKEVQDLERDLRT